MDYLNFARPYDQYFAHARRGSQEIFAAWDRTFLLCSAIRPECWLEGRISPAGHTISVSDIWFVGHYYGLLATLLGEILGMRNFHITTAAEEAIRCDIVLKCTGYWKNEAVKKLLGSSSICPNNFVRENLIYQAEAILDDAGGFQTPFGSSYVEAAAFSVLIFTSDTKYDNVSKLDLVDAPFS